MIWKIYYVIKEGNILKEFKDIKMTLKALFLAASATFVLASCGSSLAHRGYEGCDAPVAAAPPGEGDGAVGAEVVAAVLHLQEVTRAVATGTGRDETFRSCASWHSYGMFQVLHHPSFLILAENKADAGDGRHLGRLELGIAASDDDEGTGMLAHELMDSLTAFVISHLSDTARIDETDIGHLTRLRLADTQVCQLPFNGSRFSKVKLAAEGEVGGTLSAKGRILCHDALE